ncbi:MULTISPECIES: TetR/AcrR family transcriptional regulator [unclassified Mycolicibacterium]|uniref:TetR/AcrR family transcriptional regulator n=1 Tax=unclassified Mycolicibacterium TaxID=2636767 RepID=UPI00130CC9FC|nr:MULTISPECIES: TetR/AcrR family transcriptional regulator [unclassified Mycolicibacterium]MUL83033.1 helix-turn-helix transcriptional regulator [Mycolicibacterium sp. CBMA 329]MUL89368.1 helix-turn-helix transcriptional regulator [Mycolicibacterium sp. CBMA 331]MUL99057.1 helix-turn-helix transcriptional regulator [Mycolicibacterium sp. CBMA 334]MUM29975.1 helix-turn-helix transcriptional regulator [Mycolicibacterium sp. CBMA 295]MUM38884.1 helix-turn-helix transcriptional regulator [Mycolic
MVTHKPLRRRQPVQERSRRRVERIRAAALELLETQGVEAVTTRAIAQQADVPVATVYQFFPNRDAILQEIVSDHLDRRDAEGAATLAELAPTSLAEVAHGIVEFHYEHLRNHPHLVTLHYTSLASGLLADPRARRAEFARALHGALVRWGLLCEGTDPLVTMVAVEMGDRLLEMAFHAGPEMDRAILTEGERALTQYLQTYAAPAV